ncbi:GAF domain-containing sensor histidine kinase [Desulfocicer niacini]
MARYGFGQEFLDNLQVTWADTKWGQGPAGRSIRECKPIICPKISSDPNFIPWEKLAKEQGLLSGIALPLVFDSQVFGSLCIYAAEEDAFGVEEAELLEELANDISHGIMAIRAQKNLRQAKNFLRTEHEKLQSVLNAIGDSLYIVNKDYLIEFQNMVSKKTFGKLTGKKCYQGIFQRKKPCEFCLMQKTLGKNRIHQLETPPLNQKQYDVVFSPFQEADGVMKSVVAIRDITEKKYIQAETLRADRLASLGELAAGVAHEINNPITSIISLAEILTDKFHKLGGDKKIPERIIHEGERIGNIVKNLLSFARDKKEEHGPVHIKDILQAALELVEKQIHKDGIHLSVNIPSDLPKIKARSQEIQQVFLNILSNARYALNTRHTGFHKNKTLEIIGEIIKIGNNEYVRITFYDRGTGIAPNHINRVVDPFFSTKPHGEGTGLGLSVSHGIIKAHGGKLRFESQSNQYTKVMIDLPINNTKWPSRGKCEIQNSCG